MNSQYPPITTPESSGKAQRLANSVLTVCFILFVAFCNFSISIAQAAAYIGVIAWLFQTHSQKNWHKLRFPLAWPLAFFVLASIIATMASIDTALSIPGFKKLFKIIIFFWVVNALATSRPWELLGSVAGWLRRCLGMEETKPTNKNPGYSLVELLILAGVISAGIGIVQAVIHPEGIWNRYDVLGTMNNLMTYAQLLMLVTCMGLSMAISNPHRFRIWICAGIVLMGFAILLTLNRQSWLGLFLATTFLLFNKKRIYSLIPIFFAILVFILGPQTLKDRMNTMTNLQDYSVNERVLMWKAGWDILQDHPLTGCGFKCQFVIADQYPEHAILQKYTHMHSSPIQLAVDTGILGLTAWISIWIGFFINLARQLKHIPKNSSDYAIALGSGAAVIAFLVAGFFENNFYDSEIIMLMYFIMALPFVSTNASQSHLVD